MPIDTDDVRTRFKDASFSTIVLQLCDEVETLRKETERLNTNIQTMREFARAFRMQMERGSIRLEDEITRLREALGLISRGLPLTNSAQVARAALEVKDD